MAQGKVDEKVVKLGNLKGVRRTGTGKAVVMKKGKGKKW